MTNQQLAEQFFLQIAVILLVCRVVGIVAKRLGQPQVVAEMIAGVCLGPSLLGLVYPELQSLLFPWQKGIPSTQSYLYPASQLGLALYVFIVGMEFRLDILQSQWRSAVSVSLAGMLSPFILGASLGWFFHVSTDLFPPNSTRWASATFLGASMCITAFPMLARIIHFKGLTGTRMGTVAIGAGACAWCLLAIVLSSLDGSPAAALRSIGGGVLFVLFVTMIIRPLLKKLEPRLVSDGRLTEPGLVICLALMALGAFTTDRLGLHAVFGGFLMGSAIPRGVMVRDASARATGVPHREAMGIGILMNARGLMELIIINIGLERGVISSQLFAMLVIMAIVTTLMASPIFDRLVGSPPSPRTAERAN